MNVEYILKSVSCFRSELSCIGHISEARQSIAEQSVASSSVLRTLTTWPPSFSLNPASSVNAVNPALDETRRLKQRNWLSIFFSPPNDSSDCIAD